MNRLSAFLLGAGLAGWGDAVTAAWRPPTGVWYQLLSVIAGFTVVIVAVLPVPGIRTRPGLYLSAALGDPLRNFFSRYGSASTVRAMPIESSALISFKAALLPTASPPRML